MKRGANPRFIIGTKQKPDHRGQAFLCPLFVSVRGKNSSLFVFFVPL
jgi:hypothetical protein